MSPQRKNPSLIPGTDSPNPHDESFCPGGQTGTPRWLSWLTSLPPPFTPASLLCNSVYPLYNTIIPHIVLLPPPHPPSPLLFLSSTCIFYSSAPRLSPKENHLSHQLCSLADSCPVALFLNYGSALPSTLHPSLATAGEHCCALLLCPVWSVLFRGMMPGRDARGGTIGHNATFLLTRQHPAQLSAYALTPETQLWPAQVGTAKDVKR